MKNLNSVHPPKVWASPRAPFDALQTIPTRDASRTGPARPRLGLGRGLRHRFAKRSDVVPPTVKVYAVLHICLNCLAILGGLIALVRNLTGQAPGFFVIQNLIVLAVNYGFICLARGFYAGKRIAVYFYTVLGALAAGLPANTLQAAATLTLTPAAVSNTYSGSITVQVGGLTAGDTVVVQKFLDLNTNGVVEASDYLVQQFNLTDGQAGMVIGGVTNLNVPGDTDGAANGQITATLSFQNFDFIQNTVGRYLFKLSSPAGHFAPITNALVVTNFPYAQSITGNVVSNGTGTTLPNALILMFPPPRGQDLGRPLGLAVANNNGAYSLPAPPGTYLLFAVKSNFVASLATPVIITLVSGATVTTNLSLVGATQTISGRYVDANNSFLGLPGVFIGAKSQTNYYISGGFTDTNGNFTLSARPDLWGSGTSAGLIVHGYVGYNDSVFVVDTTTGSVSGVTAAFRKATSLFYGTVADTLGNPVPGIAIEAYDSNNQYQQDGVSTATGNYVVGAVGGLGSGDPYQVGVDIAPANYMFSQGTQTTLGSGQAYHFNFTALLATNIITGNVQYNSLPVSGVGVNAKATIGGTTYQPNTADTDTNGNYAFNVGNGNWTINLNCNGGSDSLDSILGSTNYVCPAGQSVTISNNNGTANFLVQNCNGSVSSLLGTWSGTWSGQSQPSAVDNYTSHLTPVSGTWTLNLQQYDPVAQTASGSLLWQGTDAYWTYTINHDTNGGQYLTGVAWHPNPVNLTVSFLNGKTSDGSGAGGWQTGCGVYRFSLENNAVTVPPYGLYFAANLSTAGAVMGDTGGWATSWDAQVFYPGWQNAMGDGLSGFALSGIKTAGVAPPTIGSPQHSANGQFQMLVNAPSGHNYTVQMATNLTSTSWTSLLVTNPGSSAFLFNDPNATNKQRFYRVLVGP
jgi:hypothetical protein